MRAWLGLVPQPEDLSRERDCLTLSTLMPGVTIKVQGVGDDALDRWRAVYRDGERVYLKRLSAYSHLNPQGYRVDLLVVDDRYLRNLVRRSSRNARHLVLHATQRATPVTKYIALAGHRATLTDAVDECAWRGILPTADDLRVAWDVACSRGHVDSDGKPREIVHVCAGPVREGEERPTWVERGPRDLVELWVGYCPREKAS